MNHEHESTFAFPSGLSDRDAAAFCDFLSQLAADADAHYLGQILRYQRSNNPAPHTTLPSRGARKIKISNRLSLFIQRACAPEYYVRHASLLTLIQIGLLSLN